MKNYLATKWKSLTAWSSVTWAQGRIGKAKVVLAWYGLAVVVMAPVALLIPDVELELRPVMTEPALLCHQQQSFDEIVGAKDVTNQALLEKFRHQPDMQRRIITSDTYMQQDAAAWRSEAMRKIARGQCREVTHGDPVTSDWMEWQSSKDTDPLKPKRMQASYQGQTYWAYAGQWQKTTGKTVAAENRAQLTVSPNLQTEMISLHRQWWMSRRPRPCPTAIPYRHSLATNPMHRCGWCSCAMAGSP